MGNLFSGLASGSNALNYYTRAIETAGHNLANAGTEGYSRQRVNASANFAVDYGSGIPVGQGVNTDSITRIRDKFLDAQYARQMISLGYYETKAQNLAYLEYYSGAADQHTFSNALDAYWADLEYLHLYPGSTTARKTVLQSAQTTIETLSNIRSQYDTFRSDLNDQIAEMVSEANDLIDEIALFSKEIAQAQNRGENPNDLLDRRDLLAERLCKLTGATIVGDAGDGDYKIDLNGMLLVQGAAQFNCDGTAIVNTRYLVLVPMVGNNGYYDVQVEGNQYNHSSNLGVASVIVERGATNPAECSKNGVHELFVERLSNGLTWTVGGATGSLSGGSRLDTIYDANQALGINGSFSLQVGTVGVKASSNAYAQTGGVILSEPAAGERTEYEFRIAAGEFESYVNIAYDSAKGNWVISTNGGATTLDTSAGSNLTAQELQKALNACPELSVTYDESSMRLEIECAGTNDMRGHLLSITDTTGSLASDLGISNSNPAVEITVTAEDTLAMIRNKINAAYMSELVSGDDAVYTTNPPGTAPSCPNEWLHANIIIEPNGSMYIALTGNVSGEANRINVLPGSVCDTNGDLSVARLLGFVDSGTDKGTSYIQVDADPNALTTIVRDGVHVNDAYFIYNGRHYLSESNSFTEARIFKTTDTYGYVTEWNNPAADKLDHFAQGIRLNLHGLNHYYDNYGDLSYNAATIIRVNPHLTDGSIYAMLESRDDIILGLEDYLDNLAYELVIQTNAIHYSGHGSGENADTTGTAFFQHVTTKYGASTNLNMNASLAKNISLLAAGSGDGTGHGKGEGDGSTALRMAQLKSAKALDSGTSTFNSYFEKFVADIGMQGYTANYMLAAQQGVVDAIATQRDSMMGVSSDEEMLDIIRYQQGVGAISRYITALDDMLDKIINGMGRAGL